MPPNVAVMTVFSVTPAELKSYGTQLHRASNDAAACLHHIDAYCDLPWYDEGILAKLFADQDGVHAKAAGIFRTLRDLCAVAQIELTGVSDMYTTTETVSAATLDATYPVADRTDSCD